MKKLLGALEMGGTKMVCAIGYADGTVAERARFDTADPVTTLAACASWFAEREIAALGVGGFRAHGCRSCFTSVRLYAQDTQAELV